MRFGEIISAIKDKISGNDGRIHEVHVESVCFGGDRDLHKERLEKLRLEFEELKKTDEFKRWKKREYACQDGKCAYCMRKIELYSVETQVDHLRPISRGGSNDFDNLVLACKECNYNLKKNNYVWRDANGSVHNGWGKPTWIKN